MKPAAFIRSRGRAAVALVLLAGAIRARADVKLPAIFGDHMVCQEGATLPVWGWADPGEKVTVTFAAGKAAATAGADGKWRAELPAVPAGTAPGVLVVTGKNTVTCHDVLIGEVWLCSGQSNMERPMDLLPDPEPAIAQATDNQIRLCRVPYDLAIAPRDNLPATGDLWTVCSPEAVRHFSAVGYYFATNLRGALRRPVGLIESVWGGTAAQVWTDLPTMQANPQLSHYARDFGKAAADYPGGDAEFFTKMHADLKPHERPGANSVTRGMGPKIPTCLFDAMIHPLIPFAIKGVIWYQGEDNAARNDGLEYGTLFPALITDWRALWHEGDFSFLYVQLANLAQRPHDNWPLVREAQLKTLALPNTGMAVCCDIGTANSVHPPDKADVGLRLALWARHVAYGENITCAGPLFAGLKAAGDKIRVSFQPDSVDGGLKIAAPPWIDPESAPLATTELHGFAVAGEDRKWVEAAAAIVGNAVLVSSPQVPTPVAVRYGWAQNPNGNLYNGKGLPASPFRTDDWDPAPLDRTALEAKTPAAP